MIAFDRPWQIVGLIALVVIVRVIIPRLSVLRSNLRASILEFDDSLLIALLIVFCVVRPFVLQAFYIPSGSMLPTLHEGDRIPRRKEPVHMRRPRDRLLRLLQREFLVVRSTAAADDQQRPRGMQREQRSASATTGRLAFISSTCLGQ